MCDRELTLTELLDDPIIQAVMTADRVDPAELESGVDCADPQAAAHAAG